MACGLPVGRSTNNFWSDVVRLLTMKQTAEKCGVSRTVIYRWLADSSKNFPRKLKPYGYKVFFVEQEIDDWLKNIVEESESERVKYGSY